MVHRTKVDWWIGALIGGGAFLLVAAGATVVVVGLIKGEPKPQAVLGIGSILASLGVLSALLLWGCCKIRYEITPLQLVVHFAPFAWKLPLDQIVEVFPTHNPISAPAPSLDRLRINYRRKSGKMWFVLISPKDKKAFVLDLASAAPHLRVAEDGTLGLKTAAPA